MNKQKTLGKFKNWIQRHKTAIIIGTITVVTGAVGVIWMNKRDAEHDLLRQEIIDTFEEAMQEWGETGDRYTIDTETMKKLPPGTYDVFDSYENERVDFVVE